MTPLAVLPRTVREVCDIRTDIGPVHSIGVGLVLLLGSWNQKTLVPSRMEASLNKLAESSAVNQGLDCNVLLYSVKVDDNEEDMRCCLGEAEFQTDHHPFPVPPSGLPALAVVAQSKTNTHSMIRYVQVPSATIIQLFNELRVDSILLQLQPIVDATENKFSIPVHANVTTKAVRIFVAGDRSSVGKSSICLGILGSLIKAGYSPDSLAYIKPATQSESRQLIQTYCEKTGIRCVPIGPLIYYRGFTRAFLAGETETTEDLLAHCGQAVDRVARGRKVVLIDGVGFPAVGSICGTSNAAVARACGYPEESQTTRKAMGVIVVGGSGVGAAVDSFNLNASFFENSGIPVLGSVFNKLDETGYYSLENCKTQVTAYFKTNEYQLRKNRQPFGFLPQFPRLSCSNSINYVVDYIEVFDKHVDVQAILRAATTVKLSQIAQDSVSIKNGHVSKRQKLESNSSHVSAHRHAIESSAIAAGAKQST